MKTKSLFVGLDLSLCNSGICIIDSDKKMMALETVKTTACGCLVSTRFKRYRYIVNQLWKIIKSVKGEVKTIAIENYSYRSAGRIIQLVESGSLVRYFFDKKLECRIVEVAPLQLKKYLLGKVKAKGTDAKNIMCREVYKQDGIEIDDDNQVDAYILSNIALDFFRMEMHGTKAIEKTIKKYRMEVLKKLA